MKQELLTEGYIEGNQECLTSITKQITEILSRITSEKASDLVKALNEIVAYLYFKQEILDDMWTEYDKQQEAMGDPFDEEACTEEVIPKEIYLLLNGRLMRLLQGGR